MDFTTLKIPGADAIRLLNEHRLRYPATGQYPFLIGNCEDVVWGADSSKKNTAAIIRASLGITIAEWIAERLGELDPETLSEWPGEWPDEILDKGSISLHKEVLTRKIKPQVHLGLARIEQPWHLPAILKFGGWNDCPVPEVHCAFHREWQERFGAEITGVSGDVVECTVKNPPTDRKAATILAWEQACYCSDVVDERGPNFAATLMNSPYWYFWWD